ncbi:hypothetical protein [Phenylobacterium sp.]|jgi:hypothetical protein|uniref:hypothetical protein n=1 Tax=Phenylobacterium sp. TaxID=1871053 RepID=UPI002F425546
MRRAGLAAVLSATAAVLIPQGAPAKQTEPAPAVAAAPAPTVSGVTVTGEKPDPLVDKTTEFVRRRLPTSQNEQYARFHDPVCVKVLGLPAEFDAFVAKRILEIAREVGASVDTSGGCQPNVDVIFSAQPQAQLSDIAKRRDVLFGFYFRAQAKKIATFSRPIQSWYLTRSVGTEGADMLELYDPAPCQTSSTGPPCDLKAPAVKGRAGSRLGNDMSSELVHSLIIADSGKVSGEPIGAVADYIAVLALSRWRGLETCSGLPTILNLMADGCGAEDRPEAATGGDLALLKGLYKVDPREAGTMQRSAIASYLRKAHQGDGSSH